MPYVRSGGAMPPAPMLTSSTIVPEQPLSPNRETSRLQIEVTDKKEAASSAATGCLENQRATSKHSVNRTSSEHSSTTTTVGKKVLTHSLSYREDSHEKPLLSANDPIESKTETSSTGCDGTGDGTKGKKLKQPRKRRSAQKKATTSCASVQTDYANKDQVGSPEDQYNNDGNMEAALNTVDTYLDQAGYCIIKSVEIAQSVNQDIDANLPLGKVFTLRDSDEVQELFGSDDPLGGAQVIDVDNDAGGSACLLHSTDVDKSDNVKVIATWWPLQSASKSDNVHVSVASDADTKKHQKNASSTAKPMKEKKTKDKQLEKDFSTKCVVDACQSLDSGATYGASSTVESQKTNLPSPASHVQNIAQMEKKMSTSGEGSISSAPRSRLSQAQMEKNTSTSGEGSISSAPRSRLSQATDGEEDKYIWWGFN